MIDRSRRALDARGLLDVAPAVWRHAVEQEIGGERPDRDRRQRHLRAEEQPALAPLAVLELAGAERDEIDRERMPFVADDLRRLAEAEGVGFALGLPLLLALLPLEFEFINIFSVFLPHVLEEVEHPLRIQLRIESEVGTQPQQLAELAVRVVRLVLEQVSDAEHAVR